MSALLPQRAQQGCCVVGAQTWHGCHAPSADFGTDATHPAPTSARLPPLQMMRYLIARREIMIYPSTMTSYSLIHLSSCRKYANICGTVIS